MIITKGFALHQIEHVLRCLILILGYIDLASEAIFPSINVCWKRIRKPFEAVQEPVGKIIFPANFLKDSIAQMGKFSPQKYES